MSRGARAGLVAALVSLFAAAPAEAAITVGSNLAADADTSVCFGVGPHSCTDSIAGLPGSSAAVGGATVPANGVLVRWRIKRAPGTIAEAALRVVRGTTGAGTSERVSVPPQADTYEFPARLPVQAGDQLGVDLILPLLGDAPVASATASATYDQWAPALADGSTRAPTSDNAAGELLLNADLEPDVDGDGFGDETQDQCPTQQGCGAGPDTQITKKPRKKTRRTSATFKFTSSAPGSSFQCSLDSRAFTACTSPHKVRAKKGKHIFLVRAVAAGIPDATPAEARWKVKKKKRRR